MWIIPKNLDVSPYVRVTLALNWDSDELSRTLERSVMWRSKPSLARTWLVRLRRVSWIWPLYGRILKPSTENRFVTEYTSSLAVIPASPSQLPANEKEQMTPDTFGRILNDSFRQLDLFGASSRTLADTLVLDTPQFTEAYDLWVIKLRQDCLQRLRSARHTRESGCLSWPTIATGRVTQQMSPSQLKRHSPNLAMTVEKENWPTPDVTNKEESAETAKKRMALHKKTNRPTGGIRNLHQVVNWGTPKEQDSRAAFTDRGKSNLGEQAQGGLLAQDSPSTNGK
ncbi:hypothetical protein LCGC14_1742000, partial [marine sediment metagenome]